MQRDPETASLLALPFRILGFIAGFFGAIFVMLTKLIFRTGAKTVKTSIAMKKNLVCPSGNCAPQPADGRWTCNNCGANREGWIWAACHVCGEAPTYHNCDTCGLSIRNPLL